MSYTINNKPLSTWSCVAGSISAVDTDYALTGQWSLPKRLGKTHHLWGGTIEPYIDSDDIHLGGRDLELSLICKANNLSQLDTCLNGIYGEMGDGFELKHPILGSYIVGLESSTVSHHPNGWGQVKLKLKEPQPVVGSILPDPDNSQYGIDGYGWSQIGLVVESVKDGFNLSGYTPLNLTSPSNAEPWLVGYHKPQTISVVGMVKGVDYNDFVDKISILQALINKAGIRRVKYFDGGDDLKVFCDSGFTINNVKRFGGSNHCGKFNCKMTSIK